MSIEFIGMACALGLSAMGSAFGSGFAAQASVGAWKKCYANGKPADAQRLCLAAVLLTLFGKRLVNHFTADKSQKNQGYPRRDRRHGFGEQRSGIIPYKRHYALKNAEKQRDKQYFDKTHFRLVQAVAHAHGRRVHTEPYPGQQNIENTHKFKNPLLYPYCPMRTIIPS